MNKYLSKAIKEWYPNGFDFAAVGLADYTVDVAKPVRSGQLVLR